MTLPVVAPQELPRDMDSLTEVRHIMSKHRVMVTQTLRVERKTVIEVDAPDISALRDLLDEGGYELPSEDSAWEIIRSDLQNEDVEALA